MYRFFDKHGKKALAVFGTFLMVAFLLPASGLNCNQSMGQAGAINGKPIHPYDVEVARNRLRALRTLIVTDPATGAPDRAFNRIFGFGNPVLGERLYDQISSNDMAWLLLATEAANNFTIASEAEIDEFFSEQAAPQVITQERPTLVMQPLTNPPAVESMKQNVRIGLAIRDQFLRSMLKIKISTPRVNQALAERGQQIQARLAIFEAATYLATVPAPSDEQLKAQFDAFAAIVPGTVSDTNPFGFGYRVPDKVRLQYIAVPQKQVVDAVVKSKSEFAWEEEARVYFSKNWEKFVKKPETSATQPATQPDTKPVKPSFESVSQQVYDAIREPLIEQKRRAVINVVFDLLNDDYNRNVNTSPTTQPSLDATVRGVKIDSYDYLLKIRDEVQRRQNVTVDVVNESNLQSLRELMFQPGIGMSLVEEPGPRDRSNPLAAYLFGSLTPLVTTPEVGVAPLGLLQPTRPLWTPEKTYVARVVQAVPSHPPAKMDEVKEQLVKDVKRKLAFAKTVEAADAAIEKAKLSGLSSLEQTVFTTDWFNAFTSRIPGVPQADGYADQIVEPVFGLLRGVESESQLPVRSVIKAQQADKVVAAEVFDIQTAISTDEEPVARSQVRYQLQMTEAQQLNLLQTWFAADNVQKRVGYVSPNEGGPAPEKPAPAPARPLIPG